MRVREIMTPDVACCTPETSLSEVARMMVDHDCGEIPVVDGRDTMRPVGVVTDRDITCRTIALGLNPLAMKAADCMSRPAISVLRDDDVDECIRTLEDHQIRRVPVVDDAGRCCGMVALADIARHGSKSETAEVVREVSKPSDAASRQPTSH
jgi:CBS domain-containing protein